MKALLIAALALTLMLSACPGSQGLPPPPPVAIIPDTTRVADPSTRDSLTTFDATTGGLRFSQTTPTLSNLRVGDVIASEPSSAAPYGYLRKVKAIQQESGQVILETAQASLFEAIRRGALEASGELKGTDLVSVRPLVPGVSIAAVSPAAGIKPMLEIGSGYNFEIGFDKTLLEITEGPAKAKLRVVGKAYFKLGWGISLGIDYDSVIEAIPTRVDRFEAWAGFDQGIEIGVEGQITAGASFGKDIKVAEMTFKPLVFFIGPVPVVVVPRANVYLGGNGSVSLSFHYGITQTAHAKVGSRWTDPDDGGRGWEDTSGFGFEVSTFSQDPDITPGIKAAVQVTPALQFMLYGIVGPEMALRLGLELDSQQGRSPYWILRGFLRGDLALVVDLPILGKVSERRAKLFDISKDLARAANQAPRITVPQGVVNADLGLPTQLWAMVQATDPEDGSVSNIGFTSDRDGPVTNSPTFSSEGLRTITAIATDSQGASSSAQFRVNVVNVPPNVFLTIPVRSVAQGVQVNASGSAYDPTDPNASPKMPCSALSWSVSPGDEVHPNPSNPCEATAIFRTQGARSLTLTATNPHGASSSKTVEIAVTPPPVNLPPAIVQGSFHILDYMDREVPENSGTPTYTNGPLKLRVQATDPEGDLVTYRWTACRPEWSPIECSSFGISIPASLDGSAQFDLTGNYGKWVIFVIVSDGESSGFGTISRRIWVLKPPV